MTVFEKLAGRPFGLTPDAFKALGNADPEAKKIFEWFAKAPEILNSRRLIVRQMQINNPSTRRKPK